MSEPTASYEEISSALQYYRDMALAWEVRVARLERLLKGVLAVTADDLPPSIPIALRREIQAALIR